MITGKIIDNQEAIIELKIVDANDTETVEAIIDTGFTGELTLPGNLIDRLGLPRIGGLPITLGDGNEIDVGLYLGMVLWQGEDRIVQVLRTDGRPLVGMSLLYGNRLILDVMTDGEVTIEALS